jgi:hypothetical protein
MSLSRTLRRHRGDNLLQGGGGSKDYGFCFICGSGFTREGLIKHFRAFHPNERQPGDDHDERHGKSGKGVVGNSEVS